MGELFNFFNICLLINSAMTRLSENVRARKPSTGRILEDKNTKCCSVRKGSPAVAFWISEVNHIRQRTIHIIPKDKTDSLDGVKPTNCILNNSGVVHV